MKRLLREKTIHQEYEELRVPSRLKNITITKRLLIAALIILAGAFTQIRSFSILAAPVNQRDAKKVVSCAYSAFMGRVPDNAGARYWQNRYIRTNYNVQDLARGLAYSPEGQREATQTGFSGFVNRSYEGCLQRTVSNSDYNALLNQYRNGVKKEDLFALIIMGGDKNVSFPSYVKCAGFLKGGSTAPLCKSGTPGTSNNVITSSIGGTNIIVNRGLLTTFSSFVSNAKSAGYGLGAYTDPALASKKLRCANGVNLLKSPGSYRSAADQACLTYLGYPTASGTSMHQWGLAVDLTCNGKPLASSGSCLTWVKNNASRFGLYNKVSNELWHYSTTGY